MDDRRQVGKLSVALLLGLTTTCLLGMTLAILLRPPRFTTHRQEIAYVLDQQGIAYERIRLEQDWRDTQNFYAYADYSVYGADVIVQLRGGREVRGRIDCHEKRTACHLFLRSLGIPDVALPDLVAAAEWPWLDWLERMLPRLGLFGHLV
jgi:hypothetical protein